MFSKEFILVLIFITLFKFSDEFHYSEPDLDNPWIPLKWRRMCGYRYLRTRVAKASRCLRSKYRNKLFFNITDRNVEPLDRVLGGSYVTGRQSPWTVQITKKNWKWGWAYPFYQYNYDTHWCTGVLITMKHILTAAHCWKPHIPLRIYGGSDWTASRVWSTDKYVFHRHPYFKDKPNYTEEWDIAVIELTTPIDLEFNGWQEEEDLMKFNTICLPRVENLTHPELNDYKMATFYGWGRVWDYETPDVLQRADVEVRYFQNKRFFYSNPDLRPRACKADSGSGLIQFLNKNEDRAVLIGINIYAIPKTNHSNEDPPCDWKHIGPTVAIRVVPHLNWINQILEPIKTNEIPIPNPFPDLIPNSFPIPLPIVTTKPSTESSSELFPESSSELFPEPSSGHSSTRPPNTSRTRVPMPLPTEEGPPLE